MTHSLPKYQNLEVKGAGKDPVAFVQGALSELGAKWEHAEFNDPNSVGQYIVLAFEGDREVPELRVYFIVRGDDLYTANILPVAKQRLTLDECNWAVTEIASALARGADGDGFETSLSPEEVRLDEALQPATWAALESFNIGVNRSEGNYHPHDRTRWLDLIATVTASDHIYLQDNLGAWLEADGWSSEVASRLQSEYEDAIEVRDITQSRVLADVHESKVLHPGAAVAGFILRERLGQGGNGEVWTAAAPTGELVAIKTLHADLDGARHQRFEREIENQRSCADVPGVLPVFAAFGDTELIGDERPWFTMPIATPLPQDLDAESAVRVVIQVATTLEQIHAAGFTHRDIKPENILILDDQPHIGDFGLSIGPDQPRVTVAKEKVGTSFFVAPEMLRSTNLPAPFPEADVYSLAKTLWVLLTGQNYPPPGQHYRSEATFRISAWTLDERADELSEILEFCTAPNPDDRPSLREFRDELRVWLDGSGRSSIDRSDQLQALAARLAASAAEDVNELQQERETQKREQLLVAEVQQRLVEMAAPFTEAAGLGAIGVQGGRDPYRTADLVHEQCPENVEPVLVRSVYARSPIDHSVRWQVVNAICRTDPHPTWIGGYVVAGRSFLKTTLIPRSELGRAQAIEDAVQAAASEEILSEGMIELLGKLGKSP